MPRYSTHGGSTDAADAPETVPIPPQNLAEIVERWKKDLECMPKTAAGTDVADALHRAFEEVARAENFLKAACLLNRNKTAPQQRSERLLLRG